MVLGCAGWGRRKSLSGPGSVSALLKRNVVPYPRGGQEPEACCLISPLNLASLHCFSWSLRRSLVPKRILSIEFAGHFWGGFVGGGWGRGLEGWTGGGIHLMH